MLHPAWVLEQMLMVMMPVLKIVTDDVRSIAHGARAPEVSSRTMLEEKKTFDPRCERPPAASEGGSLAWKCGNDVRLF
jgi:hypothetical protein